METEEVPETKAASSEAREAKNSKHRSCKSDDGEGDDSEDDGDDDEDEMDSVMQELAKCYYAMNDLRVRKFKSEYEWVDTLIKSSNDDGSGVESRRGSKSREEGAGKTAAKLNESMALDLWGFVEPLVQRKGGKFVGVTPSELKEILGSVLQAINTDKKLMVYEGEISTYLTNVCDALPSMSELLPDFASVLVSLPPAPGMAHVLAEGPAAKKAKDKHDCLKQVFFLLAECFMLGNEEQIRGKIQYYLVDLYINPNRKESWIGLADSYDELLQTSASFGIRYCAMVEHSKVCFCNMLRVCLVCTCVSVFVYLYHSVG